MKQIQLKTPTGRNATMDLDIERFNGMSVEAFLIEYVDYYDRAFSTISRQRIIDALRELWELEYPSEKTEETPKVELDPEAKPVKKNRKAAE